MKRNLLYILISLCVALTSCEDFLNVKPQTQVPTEDFFNNEAGYEDALIGCYVKMTSSNLYGRFLTMSGIDYLAQYYNKMSLTSDGIDGLFEISRKISLSKSKYSNLCPP